MDGVMSMLYDRILRLKTREGFLEIKLSSFLVLTRLSYMLYENNKKHTGLKKDTINSDYSNAREPLYAPL